MKELRCGGKNKKGQNCDQLLYKYDIKEDEITVEIKCGNCNTYSILHLPFNKSQNNNK